MAVTLKEIAKEANVSIAAVSMILNNKNPNISDETRERVLNIAKKLNYVPNTMARSLVTKRTNTIGLIMPDISNPFFSDIARGAEDRANMDRYSVFFCNTDDSLRQEEKYIDILTEKMVDGIIFAHSGDNEGGSPGLNKCRVPVILIDRDYDTPNVRGRVMVNNTEGSYAGVTHLLENGYRKIIYIAGSLKTGTAKDRFEGYKKALQSYNIDFNMDYVKAGTYRSEWGAEAVTQLEADGIEYDSIFCGNDLIAIGALKKLKELGRKVPDNVGVVGFDDIYMAACMEPELTTVKQPNYEMGYQAVDLLIRAIKHPRGKMEKNHITLNTHLVVRKSTILRYYIQGKERSSL